ncbi:MAG: 2-amino-4-hydroxy-6-hydroxymethyldihydropteridine diphosphokinase [Zetaproteobacteria bacterium]|nr:MAG: 2-amino-4-hydroxy-6-hydroxymethyldihydropteridine diphosphokinase [Zetaproteobacteria bacterium]
MSPVVSLIGLGSNIEPELHLRWASHMLRRHFGSVRFSHVYRSPAIGMDGADFLNACCLVQAEIGLPDLKVLLKSWEDARGRDRSRGSWRPRTLDLDVLMHDGRIVDDELLQYAHAYVPAVELVELPEVAMDVSCLHCVDLRL